MLDTDFILDGLYDSVMDVWLSLLMGVLLLQDELESESEDLMLKLEVLVLIELQLVLELDLEVDGDV